MHTDLCASPGSLDVSGSATAGGFSEGASCARVGSADRTLKINPSAGQMRIRARVCLRGGIRVSPSGSWVEHHCALVAATLLGSGDGVVIVPMSTEIGGRNRLRHFPPRWPISARMCGHFGNRVFVMTSTASRCRSAEHTTERRACSMYPRKPTRRCPRLSGQSGEQRNPLKLCGHSRAARTMRT